MGLAGRNLGTVKCMYINCGGVIMACFLVPVAEAIVVSVDGNDRPGGDTAHAA